MRTTALLVALLALTASAQSPRFKRFTQRTDQGRNSRGLLANAYAFFEAFPASAAGLTTACSTTAPTGAKGEALTFTRTGSATCTKTATGGLATTGIADGDLVTLAGNVARVEYDSAGVLGLRVESSRTNSIVRSQELNNAAWAITGTSVAGPVVTPDYGTAPDGTMTAERVQVAACSPASSQSTVSQTPAAGAGATANTYYVKALSGSPTIQVCSYGTTSNGSCTPCAVNTSTWTRCSNQFTTAGTTYTLIGCINNPGVYSGSSNTGAADVLVWGAQSEAGAYATSYIPTTTASAVRNVDVPSFALADGLSFGSLAASVTVPWSTSSGSREVALAYVNGTNFWEPFFSSSASPSAFTFVASVSDTVGVVAPITAYTAARIVQYRTATPTLCIIKDGTSACDGTGVGATITTSGGTGLLRVGRDTSNGFEIDGVVSRLCLDSDPTRCR